MSARIVRTEPLELNTRLDLERWLDWDDLIGSRYHYIVDSGTVWGAVELRTGEVITGARPWDPSDANALQLREVFEAYVR